MELELTETNGLTIAEAVSAGIVVATVQDAVDLIGNAAYLGADYTLLHERHLGPEFFDLKTGLAGEVLQKYANYRMGLVVIGDFDAIGSESLRALIRECNRGGRIAFVPDRDAALARIAP